MKKSNCIVLLITPVLGTMLVAGCGGGGSSTSRDVYNSLDDCLKDWNEAELCSQMNDDDDREYRSYGGVGTTRRYWGPTYYPSDRTVLYKGKTITPSTKSTTLTPFSVTSRSTPSSRSSVSTPRSTSSYGGFGGGGGGGGS